MYLRNKHTGQIIEWEKNITYKVGKIYTSLDALREDWEDYEPDAATIDEWRADLYTIKARRARIQDQLEELREENDVLREEERELENRIGSRE